MCKIMAISQWLIGTSALFVLSLEGAVALRNVVLTIKPEIVPRYHQSTLQCSYDLQGATLYTVKWYRGTHEFYRYTPSEQPASKVFPIAGITVDVYNSNSTQVLLTNIEFILSGSFSCEVTTTEEPISTETAWAKMLVVQYPSSPPTISVGREPLDYGDFLRANCSSPPARPPATLIFMLNNRTVARTDQISVRKSSEPSWSDLPLSLKLAESHFENGKLILRCVAQVLNSYREEAELPLDSAREPVPERVSAVNIANSLASHQIILQIILFSLFLLVQS